MPEESWSSQDLRQVKFLITNFNHTLMLQRALFFFKCEWISSGQNIVDTSNSQFDTWYINDTGAIFLGDKGLDVDNEYKEINPVELVQWFMDKNEWFLYDTVWDASNLSKEEKAELQNEWFQRGHSWAAGETHPILLEHDIYYILRNGEIIVNGSLPGREEKDPKKFLEWCSQHSSDVECPCTFAEMLSGHNRRCRYYDPAADRWKNVPFSIKRVED